MSRWRGVVRGLVICSSTLVATAVLAESPKTVEPLAQRIAVTGISLEDAREFFEKLQAAVRKNDHAAVGALVEFPLEASVGGTRKTIRSRSGFERNYASIMCKQVREVILAQQFDALFASSRGLMIGRGEVWFNGVCQDTGCKTHHVRITTINGPFHGKCPR